MSYRGHMQKGVAVLDTPADLPDGTPVVINVEPRESSFWQNKNVAELAIERGVQPLRSLDELAGDWPVDDSIDEFLTVLRKARS
jgi:hypothetical protein